MFWKYLNKETQDACAKVAGFILQMDGNLWAGGTIISGDPKRQNQNGKLFENYLLKNPNLSVVNALKLCEGKITRKRNTKDTAEKGILDFFVVCEKILPHVTRMVIDEKGLNALTKYRGGNPVKSDHNMLKLELNLTVHGEEKHIRIEMFNLRNKACQKLFKEYPTSTDRFTKCFDSDENFDVQF